MTFEKPIDAVSTIVDCLTQMNRPIGFLLGAGCPCSIKSKDDKPLIPDTDGLTSIVLEALRSGESKAAIDFVVTQCIEAGTKSPNIEQILTRMRSLLSAIGTEGIAGLKATDIARAETGICKSIIDHTSVELPDEKTAYHKLAHWVSAQPRIIPVELFTTNYDLLLEQALESARVPYFDGFIGSYNGFFDAYAIDSDRLPARWVRLWKLHGSLNWTVAQIGSESRLVRGKGTNQAVIYPSHLKYDESRKMPFLAMMDRLRSFLLQPSAVLVTVGYSFNDQHLNEILLEGLRRNASAVLFANMYSSLESSASAKNVGMLCPNIRIHATNGAVVGMRETTWKCEDSDPGRSAIGESVSWTKTVLGENTNWEPTYRLGDFGTLGNLLYVVSGGKTNSSR